MRLSIIGAGGFLGQRLTALASDDPAITELLLNDVVPPAAPGNAIVIGGSFAEDEVRARIADADAVVVLASILGGAAEADYDLARKINVDAVLDLFEHLRDHRPGCRVVFASTIAVFGDMPGPVTDQTAPDPSLTYGAQKLMMETALSHFTKRGWLDGVSLRLAGIMARDGADAALKSAFMSRLFWCVKRGEDIDLPVSEAARTWLTSIDAAARNFLHAVTCPDLGSRRAFTLPALSITFGELVAALRRAFPDSPSRITFTPDAETMRLFGSFPGLETATADGLGFARDADADALVAGALT
jgi:nucleoside-diphosphate-sugar epimerase